jgi:hypothetical protein
LQAKSKLERHLLKRKLEDWLGEEEHHTLMKSLELNEVSPTIHGERQRRIEEENGVHAEDYL